MAYNRNFQNSGVPFKQNVNYPQPFRQPTPVMQPKRSGATYTKMRKGKHEGLICVNAWRKTRYGLQTASCMPVDGVEHIGKEKGHSFMRYVVNLSNTSMGTNETYWCVMRLDTKTIVIKELGLCITPNGNGVTSSGKRVSGYFGSNFKRR